MEIPKIIKNASLPDARTIILSLVTISGLQLIPGNALNPEVGLSPDNQILLAEDPQMPQSCKDANGHDIPCTFEPPLPPQTVIQTEPLPTNGGK